MIFYIYPDYVELSPIDNALEFKAELQEFLLTNNNNIKYLGGNNDKDCVYFYFEHEINEKFAGRLETFLRSKMAIPKKIEWPKKEKL